MAVQESRAELVEPAAEVLDEARLGVGVTLWLASEAMFFAGLFATYFTLRAGADAWPPAGATLDTARSAVFTAVLLTSSVTMVRAERNHARGRPASPWVWASVVLGAVFLTNQLLEYGSLGFGVRSSPYGSIYVVLTGFHGLHVLGGLALLTLAAGRVRRDPGPRAYRMVRVGAMYWHFVDVVWVVLFLVVFVLR